MKSDVLRAFGGFYSRPAMVGGFVGYDEFPEVSN